MKYLLVIGYIFTLSACQLVSSSSSSAHVDWRAEKFYYTFDEKKTLTPHPTKLIVRFSGSRNKDELKESIELLPQVTSQQWVDDRTVILTADDSAGQGNLLDNYSQNKNVVSIHPIYTSGQHGLEVGITDEFVVQFSDNITTADIDRLNEEHQVTILKKDSYYLLRVPPREDALEIANTYYETGLTRFSHPNFIAKAEMH